MNRERQLEKTLRVVKEQLEDSFFGRHPRRNQWSLKERLKKENDLLFMIDHALKGPDFIPHQEDEISLMRTLLNSEITLTNGTMQIKEAIFNVMNGVLYSDSLEIQYYGIRYNHNESLVYVCPKLAEKAMLEDTKWEAIPIKEILLRIPGSEWKRKWFAGNRPFVVTIPIQWIKEKDLFTPDQDQ
jgi:hypothetical protein